MDHNCSYTDKVIAPSPATATRGNLRTQFLRLLLATVDYLVKNKLTARARDPHKSDHLQIRNSSR